MNTSTSLNCPSPAWYTSRSELSIWVGSSNFKLTTRLFLGLLLLTASFYQQLATLPALNQLKSHIQRSDSTLRFSHLLLRTPSKGSTVTMMFSFFRTTVVIAVALASTSAALQLPLGDSPLSSHESSLGLDGEGGRIGLQSLSTNVFTTFEHSSIPDYKLRIKAHDDFCETKAR